MKLQYLRAFIVLLADLITLIINIRTGREVTVSLLIVLIVTVVFYFIATLVVEVLQKGLEKAQNIDRELDEQKRLQERQENQENSFGDIEEEF